MALGALTYTEHRRLRQRTARRAMGGLWLLTGLLVLGASGLWGTELASLDEAILWQIRLPRYAGAWLAGALLGVSGALAQTVLRNPLADPYLLGGSSGAGLGVALGLWVLHHAHSGIEPSLGYTLGTSGAAFLGSLAAVALTVGLAAGVNDRHRLLLCGLMVGVMAGAITSLLMSHSPDLQVQFQAYALGTLVWVNSTGVGVMGCFYGVGMGLVHWLAPSLEGLALGERAAAAQGVPTQWLRWVAIGLMAWLTAGAVAQVGLMAFIGLAAPHMVRPWTAGQQRYQMWLSGWMGGFLLLLADILAQRLSGGGTEIATGVITALLGGMYWLVLLRHQSVVDDA